MTDHFRSDFRDALVGHRHLTLRIVDERALSEALAKEGLTYHDPLVAATQWLVSNGEVLPGVEAKEDEDGD